MLWRAVWPTVWFSLGIKKGGSIEPPIVGGFLGCVDISPHRRSHLATVKCQHNLADLLELMRKREAQFTVEYQGNTVRFDTDADIGNAARRLNPTNVRGDTRDITGAMVGIVPATRTCQMDPTNGPSIHGHIGREIGNLRAAAQQYTQRQVRATIRTVRVGRGAPRHTLIRISAMPNPSPEIP